MSTQSSSGGDDARPTRWGATSERLAEAERDGWSAFRDRLLRSRLIATVVLCTLVAVLVVVALAPAAYSAGVILIVSSTALFAFWFGEHATVRLQVPVGAALLAIGLWRRPELWLATWMAWSAAALGTVALARVADASSRARTRYDDMVNGLDAMVWEAPGPTGDADYMSGRVTELLGFDPREVARFSFLASHVHPEDLDTVIESRRRLAAGRDVEVHYRIRDAWARQRHLHERVRVELDHDGRVLRRRGIVVDETARWEAERSVRSYVDFIEGIPIALAILRLDDPDDPRSLRVVVGNPAAAALVGRSPDQVVGHQLIDLLPASEPMLDRLADVVRVGVALERPGVTLGDDEAVHALRAMPLPDQCLGVALEDVTKRARLAESLRHQALHDHLTGLPNRAQLNQRLGAALERARADGSRTGLLLMDLNQFKEVNDSLGHEYGDKLLVELARRLSRGMRGCDTIARLGGDEFAVLLTDVRDEEAARGVADRLVELCVEPFAVGDFQLQVGASVGVAISPDHAPDAAALLRCADSAMYRAKEAGGGIVAHSEDLPSEGTTRIDLLAELTEAVSSDELVVHYQPRVSLGTLQPIGVEALVRWRHPRRGLLPPAAFLDLAEVSGTIQMLTRVVTRRVLDEVPTLSVPGDFTVAVNLSSRNLGDPELEQWIGEVVDGSRLAPSSLCFELSERMLMADPGLTLESLHRLRRLGVRLAVDDFGTGFSSMPFLRELPLDEVKIDRRFVADLEAGDDTIARSVIDMGHNLGLHVVAEGVESAVAVRRLRELGCDSAQGYHLGTPMPLDELARHLAQPRTGWETQLTER